MSLLRVFGERQEREVQRQAAYVAGVVRAQRAAGDELPYIVYARVRGLDPGQTARQVGQGAIGLLGEGLLLDASVAEAASSLVVDGALISFVPGE